MKQIRAAGYTGDNPGELPPVIELVQAPAGGRRYSAADVMTFANNVQAQTGWKYDLTGIYGPPMNSPWTFWPLRRRQHRARPARPPTAWRSARTPPSPGTVCAHRRPTALSGLLALA
jgi:hypothetical protein